MKTNEWRNSLPRAVCLCLSEVRQGRFVALINNKAPLEATQWMQNRKIEAFFAAIDVDFQFQNRGARAHPPGVGNQHIVEEVDSYLRWPMITSTLAVWGVWPPIDAPRTSRRGPAQVSPQPLFRLIRADCVGIDSEAANTRIALWVRPESRFQTDLNQSAGASLEPRKTSSRKTAEKLVHPTGFEPVASAFGGLFSTLI